VPKPADLLELFSDEARVDLDMQIKASEALDRNAAKRAGPGVAPRGPS
jgi:hypothetical protein